MVTTPATLAVFVDHDGHVVAGVTELLEQVVQPLALRHDDGGPDVVVDVEVVPVVERPRALQHVLGMQDAFDVVHVVADDRETRVPGFATVGQDVLRRLASSRER